MIFLLQFILIIIFVIVGMQKVMGSQQQIEIFNHLRLSQRLRVITGWTELIGVVGLIISFWMSWVAAIAGLWFAATMLVGLITHIRVKDSFSKTIPAFVLMVLSITLSILSYTELQNILS